MITYPKVKAKKYTLSLETRSALSGTCRALAGIIDDLHHEGYQYIMTGRFQTDLLERRFLVYCQMCGGRFLVGLQEILQSEKVLATLCALNLGYDPCQEDIFLELTH